jgi:uncharacterized protein with HEPN domain
MIKDDLAYIEHIPDCIRKINEFSNGLSLREFKTNEMVQDAIIRNIEIIGEAPLRSTLYAHLSSLTSRLTPTQVQCEP